MEKHRTHFFIAIPVSYEIREWLYSYRKKVENVTLFKKWVHEEDYHITLAFLGFVENEKLDELKQLLKKELHDFEAFSLSPTTIDIFGQKGHPRILWVGVEQSQKLMDLQKVIVDVCVQSGIQLETRPYRPHITIARKWLGEVEFNINKEQESLETITGPSKWDVKKVVLYQSHIGKSPMYEPKELFSLKI